MRMPLRWQKLSSLDTGCVFLICVLAFNDPKRSRTSLPTSYYLPASMRILRSPTFVLSSVLRKEIIHSYSREHTPNSRPSTFVTEPPALDTQSTQQIAPSQKDEASQPGEENYAAIESPLVSIIVEVGWRLLFEYRPPHS